MADNNNNEELSSSNSGTTDMNLLGESTRIAGLVLMLAGMFAAFSLAVWVICNRASPVVKAMQPTFLIMLCVGIVISNFVIYSLGANDVNSSNVDAACVLQFWSAGIGSSFVLSALFSKLLRVNRIFNGGRFRRTVVTAKDVLKPFSLLLSLNVLFLTIMTVVDPPKWVREVTGDDPTDTVGYCKYEGAVGRTMEAMVALVNFVALLYLCRQAYQARDIGAEYSEARGVALALFSMLQTVVLVAPTIALMSREETDARYILEVLQEFVTTFALLFFIFGPIISHERRHRRGSGPEARSSVLGRRVTVSGLEIMNDGNNSAILMLQNELVESQRRISKLESELTAFRKLHIELDNAESATDSNGETTV